MLTAHGVSTRQAATLTGQIHAQLLDEGLYLCSVSTMYRVLAENTLVAERRRLARHPSQVCPELVATAPRQVYSWDITKLAGPVKGTYFDAYVMIDIYSRYLVGIHVHAHESGLLARELMGGRNPWTGATPGVSISSRNERRIEFCGCLSP
jgi:transposase InsO family protein